MYKRLQIFTYLIFFIGIKKLQIRKKNKNNHFIISLIIKLLFTFSFNLKKN